MTCSLPPPLVTAAAASSSSLRRGSASCSSPRGIPERLVRLGGSNAAAAFRRSASPNPAHLSGCHLAAALRYPVRIRARQRPGHAERAIQRAPGFPAPRPRFRPRKRRVFASSSERGARAASLVAASSSAFHGAASNAARRSASALEISPRVSHLRA